MGNVACEHRAALVLAARNQLASALQRAAWSGSARLHGDTWGHPGEVERANRYWQEAQERCELVIEALQMALVSVRCEDCEGAPDPRQLSMWAVLS